ncbi:hypothetical protein V7457_27225 [Bacillus toyonensis]|uniref:hypothetical protein n=1 Tax=Bacillus toyonensis TaxID=155322 RepID=UPI002FFDC2B1
MTENISISGQVQGNDITGSERIPIFNIKVSAYHDRKYVDHVFTDEQGKYQFYIPSGKPISVCFDTHWSLTNAREWHPSVVANIDVKENIVLNRFLMRVGESYGGVFDIDALTAYQFIAMWTERTEIDSTYAEYAAFRVSQLMLTLPELQEFQPKLMEFFLKKSQSS